MSSQSAVAPPPRPRRKRTLVSIALVTTAVLAVAVTVLFASRERDGALGARPEWRPPEQTMLTSSLAVQPVRGWTVGLTGLGLPPQTKLATSDDPAWSNPFIGYLADTGYFLATAPGSAGKQWWLVGIDARSGESPFAPVPLDAGRNTPKCFLNGPDAVLCIADADSTDAAQKSTAWVIGARTGTMTFTGPTELRWSPGQLRVHQVGTHAVATSQETGAFGVGPHAETTWFVPGDGSVQGVTKKPSDTTPSPLAVQGIEGRGSNRMVVFSLSDGRVLSPDPADGVTPQSAAVYPGGFAVEVAADQHSSKTDAVQFFDSTGQRLGQVDVSGLLSTAPADVPIVRATPKSTVFSPEGGRLVEISGFGVGNQTILIGDRLFVEDRSGATRWQQYDLRTGLEGESCRTYMGGYIGTDGTTAVFEIGNPNVGLTTTGMELATCDTRWTISSPIGSFHDVWRLNTTLVQLSDDGTTLNSLVAPN